MRTMCRQKMQCLLSAAVLAHAFCAAGLKSFTDEYFK